MDIDIGKVEELIDCLSKSKIDVMRLETQDFKLTLERVTVIGKTEVQSQIQVPAQAPTQSCAAEPQAEEKKGTIMKSPIVGTFYASAEPSKPPFATVGQKVSRGDTIYIIESMKLMNEITSDVDGTVAEIMVKSGQPVEYGQPIMRIE